MLPPKPPGSHSCCVEDIFSIKSTVTKCVLSTLAFSSSPSCSQYVFKTWGKVSQWDERGEVRVGRPQQGLVPNSSQHISKMLRRKGCLPSQPRPGSSWAWLAKGEPSLMAPACPLSLLWISAILCLWNTIKSLDSVTFVSSFYWWKMINFKKSSQEKPWMWHSLLKMAWGNNFKQNLTLFKKSLSSKNTCWR